MVRLNRAIGPAPLWEFSKLPGSCAQIWSLSVRLTHQCYPLLPTPLFPFGFPGFPFLTSASFFDFGSFSRVRFPDYGWDLFLLHRVSIKP